MDPFQVRLRFVNALNKINASLPTIQKALSFIVEYGPHMHSELWSCIIDEFRSVPLGRRINLLFFVDSIFTDDTLSPTIRSFFKSYLETDLYTLIDYAVPANRWDAMLNFSAVEKIVAAWKTRFVLDRALLEDLETMLTIRKQSLHALSPNQRSQTLLPPNEMQRRIEEDRERHKRLRERSWILPPTSFSQASLFGSRPEQLDPTYSRRAKEDEDRIWTTQELDFSQMWEETSDFNDDDVDEIREDDKNCWVNQMPPPPLPLHQPLAPTAVGGTPTAAPPAQPASQNLPPRGPASMRFAQRSS